jgi:hypothetical protein
LRYRSSGHNVVSGVEPFCVAALYQKPRQRRETAIRQPAAVEPASQRCAGLLQHGRSVEPGGPIGTWYKDAGNISLICGLFVSWLARLRRHGIAQPQLIRDPGAMSKSWEVPGSAGLHRSLRTLTGLKIWLIFQKTSGICVCNINAPDIFRRDDSHSTARLRPHLPPGGARCRFRSAVP